MADYYLQIFFKHHPALRGFSRISFPFLFKLQIHPSKDTDGAPSTNHNHDSKLNSHEHPDLHGMQLSGINILGSLFHAQNDDVISSFPKPRKLLWPSKQLEHLRSPRLQVFSRNIFGSHRFYSDFPQMREGVGKNVLLALTKIEDSLKNEVSNDFGLQKKLDFELRRWYGRIDKFQASKIFRELRNPFLALGFFSWLKLNPGFKADVFVYCSLLKICGRAKRFSQTDNLLVEMEKEGCDPNVVAYTEVIQSLALASHHDKAMQVYAKMQRLGIKPSAVTFSVLISIHLKAREYDQAFMMFEDVRREKISMDSALCNHLILLFWKMNRYSDANAIFSSMKSSNCIPTLSTYNLLIDLNAKRGYYERAMELFEELKTAGLSPNVITFTSMLNLVQKLGFLENDVANLSQQMKDLGVKPDRFWYGSLLNIYIREGDMEKVERCFSEMQANGIPSDRVFFNSSLLYHLKTKQHEKAKEALGSIQTLHPSPTLDTYVHLFQTLVSSLEDEKEAEKVFRLMEQTKHPLHDLVCIFAREENANERRGLQWKEAGEHILHLCKKQEEVDHACSFVDCLISFLVKVGRLHSACLVWDDVISLGLFERVKNESTNVLTFDFHGMSIPTAFVALRQEFIHLEGIIMDAKFSAKTVCIVTGWGRGNHDRGQSQMKDAVLLFLSHLNSPFACPPYHLGRVNLGMVQTSGGMFIDWLQNKDVILTLHCDSLMSALMNQAGETLPVSFRMPPQKNGFSRIGKFAQLIK